MIATGVVLSDICLRYFPVLQLYCLQNILYDSHNFRTSLTARLDYMDAGIPAIQEGHLRDDRRLLRLANQSVRDPLYFHGPNVYD